LQIYFPEKQKISSLKVLIFLIFSKMKAHTECETIEIKKCLCYNYGL